MKKYLTFILAIIISITLFSQEEDAQSRESQAMDATATQWSFQLAYQLMPDYYSDDVNGAARAPGLDNYLQIRIVAPIPFKRYYDTSPLNFSPLRRFIKWKNRYWEYRTLCFDNSKFHQLGLRQGWYWSIGYLSR